jgi:hypothetical protein
MRRRLPVGESTRGNDQTKCLLVEKVAIGAGDRILGMTSYHDITFDLS